MGFIDRQKGARRMRFHAIKLKDLYAQENDPGETGGGEIDTHSPDGEPDAPKRTPRLLDELREEERERFTLEGGDGTSIAEAQGGTSDL